MRKVLVLLITGLLIINSTKGNPVISFFNEMKTPALTQLFKDSTIILTLQKLHAEIRMGILDLTPERAEIVRRLNQSGIPVVAWLLLPEEQGYWFNSTNGSLAIDRYIATKKWIDENKLVFKGMGLDLEIDINDAKLIKKNIWKFIAKIPGRLYDQSAIEEGRMQYGKLIRMIKADGYMVESYYVGFIKDESAHNRTALQQVTKFLDTKTDREIPKLYSSFMGLGDGLIQVYGIDANARYMALGITGGGVDTTFSILEYDELVHDMNIASKKAEELHIFSLEGCVSNGYLDKLLTYTYDSTLVVDKEDVADVKEIQRKVISLSSVLSHPTLILLAIFVPLLLLAWLIFFLVRKLIKVLGV